MRRFAVCLTAIAICLLSAGRLRAGLIAYEGFSYVPSGGSILGDNGGLGFNGPWSAGGFNAVNNGDYFAGSNSLLFSSLASSGNHVFSNAIGVNQGIAGITRALETSFTGGSTFYVSVLLRPEGALNQGNFNGFFGLYLNGSTGNDLFIGKSGGGSVGDYVVETRGGIGQVSSNVSAVVGQTTLLVLKVELPAVQQVSDTFTLYVNPTLGSSEPSTGTVKHDINIGNISGLTIYSTGAFSIDEIRIGDAFADVTPLAAPEPASCILLSIGLVSLAGFGWGQRKAFSNHEQTLSYFP
jgi:hypothetical protein